MKNAASVLVSLALLLLVVLPAPALAQRTAWGISASFTPTWTTPNELRPVFSADEVRLEGQELRIGFVRGRTYRGDWGLSFVRKTMKSGGVVDADGNRDVLNGDVVLTGGTIDKFGVFSTIKDRVQFGLLTAIGVAKVAGTAQRNGLETVSADEVLTVVGQRTSVSPLVRFELGMAVIVTEGFKLRVSGGLNYPGVNRITVGGVVLFDR